MSVWRSKHGSWQTWADDLNGCLRPVAAFLYGPHLDEFLCSQGSPWWLDWDPRSRDVLKRAGTKNGLVALDWWSDHTAGGARLLEVCAPR